MGSGCDGSWYLATVAATCLAICLQVSVFCSTGTEALTGDEAFEHAILQIKGARRARRLKSSVGRDARKLVCLSRNCCGVRALILR